MCAAARNASSARVETAPLGMELLRILAARANFTYTLQLPTDSVEGSPNYGQGQADVENKTADVYFGARAGVRKPRIA